MVGAPPVSGEGPGVAPEVGTGKPGVPVPELGLGVVTAFGTPAVVGVGDVSKPPKGGWRVVGSFSFVGTGVAVELGVVAVAVGKVFSLGLGLGVLPNEPDGAPVGLGVSPPGRVGVFGVGVL